MRNLIRFLKRFQIFLVFIGLQIVAFSIYFSFSSFPRSQYLTSASKVSGELYTLKHSLTKHFNLSQSMDVIQKKNIQLMEKLPENFIQIDKTVVKIDDTLYHQKYTYIPGSIVNSTVNKANNYFTINVGETHGVKQGMGVISDNGIVGTIHSTSSHFSVVKSVLTQNINVDVMIESLGLFGLLKWDPKKGELRGKLSGISNDLKIDKWSKVVTRGGAGIFPKGLMVGKVEKLEEVEGEAFWDVTILFSEDYRKLQRIYVVKNLLLEEQKLLEAEIPSDEDDE